MSHAAEPVDAVDPEIPVLGPVPVVPRRRWGRPAVVSLGALASCAALGAWVRLQPTGLDTALHTLAVRDRSAAVIGLARVVTEGGSTVVIWPVIAVAALTFPRSSGAARWLASAAVAGGAAAGIGVRLLLSDMLRRPRPPATDWATTAGGYAFPSGHTTAATIGAGLLAWALSRHLRGRGTRAAVWTTAVLWAGGVGVTRIVLGVHWPLDVVGGWALGTGWLLAMAAASDAILRRRSATASRLGTGTDPVQTLL